MMLCAALGAVALCASLAEPAHAEKRVALVVGNNAYAHVPRLMTAVNDARAVGKALQGLGFRVVVAENQSRQELSRALLAFDKMVDPGDTAFFFFAGHGFEIRGQNYLIPTDVPTLGEDEEELLRDASIAAERIVERLQARGARVAILVLDACRNNPFERPGNRGLRGTRGLAPMTPAEGVFIVFSAGAKQTALDQLGSNDRNPNSVFTRTFVRQLTTPNLTLVQLAKRTQTEVKASAARVGHEQTPAYYDQVVGDVTISPSTNAAVAAAIPQVPALPGADAQQLLRDNGPASTTDNQLIATLDALAAAGSWRELHGHLTDISPTSRDAHWQRLVEQAALGEIEPLTATGGSAAERLETIKLYYPEFPSLAGSAQFLALRAKVGLDAFARCFDSRYGGHQCLDELERFVHVPPLSAELARDAAHLVGVKFNRHVASLFYVTALDAPGGNAVCTDAELLSYDLVIALQDPPDHAEAKAARTITERCWDAVKTVAVANLAREIGESPYLRNTCPILLQHQALSGLLEKRCQAVVNAGNP